MHKITCKQARELFVEKQLLTETKLPKGQAGTYKVIDQLGYIQIDTISVVERSHHIVLYTRNPNYTHQHLHDLQAKDKKIFEVSEDYSFPKEGIQEAIESELPWLSRFMKQ